MYRAMVGLVFVVLAGGVPAVLAGEGNQGDNPGDPHRYGVSRPSLPSLVVYQDGEDLVLELGDRRYRFRNVADLEKFLHDLREKDMQGS